MMGLNNYFVVRKNPKGGFSYVEGHISDNGIETVDIPVSDISKVYETFDDCMTAALEDNAENGVITHPECSLDDVLSEIRSFEETSDYWDDNGVQLKKDGNVIVMPNYVLEIRARYA